MFCLLGNLYFPYTDLFVSDPYARHSQSLRKGTLQQQTKGRRITRAVVKGKKGKVGIRYNSEEELKLNLSCRE